jgi:hypothetical protein
MKFTFEALAFICLVLGICNIPCNAQQKIDSFTIQGYVFSDDQVQLTKLVDNCSDYLHKISMRSANSTVFEVSFCGVDSKDVQFIQKGYLTVLEHYSSPVGWSEYVVFDICKKRIMLTRRIEEGEKISWDQFIDMNKDFKDNYIVRIQEFK